LSSAEVIGDLFRSGSGSVVVEFTEPWPPEQLAVIFGVENSCPANITLPAVAPISYARALIAERHSLPVSEVFLGEGIDPGQRVCDFVANCHVVLPVRIRRISIEFHENGQVMEGGVFKDVFVSDRFFDLKRRFCELFRLRQFDLFFVHFLIHGIEPDDCASISRYEFSDPLVINVEKRDVGICRLFFCSLTGDEFRYLVNLSTVRDRTLRHYAGDDLMVGFEYEGKRQRRSTLIASRFWDPMIPIRMIARKLAIVVHIDETDQNLEFLVNNTLKVDQIITALRERVPSLKSCSLFCNGTRVHCDSRILDISPDFEDDFTARDLRFEINAVEPIFRYVAPGGFVSIPAGRGPLTVLTLKQKLAPSFFVQPSFLSLSLDRQTLGDNDLIDCSRLYCIHAQREKVVLHMRFRPSSISPDKARLSEVITCDLARFSTVGDLPRLIGDHFSRTIAFRFHLRGQVLSFRDALSSFADNATIDAVYSVPRDPGRQRFLWHGDRNGPEMLELLISLDQTVREVKRRVLDAFQASHWLTGTITLSFIVPLQDEISWGEYGIPDDSLIAVKASKQLRRPVGVTSRHVCHIFQFDPSDTINDLESALRSLRGRDSPDFVLAVDSERSTERIASLG
jgi:hypothetical protein